MTPFLVTVNLAIYQILEHIDAEGWYGNMLDIIEVARIKRDQRHRTIDAMEGKVKTNRPLPCFIVPPDEVIRFKSFMRRLSKNEFGDGKKIGDLLPKDWQILT